MVDDGADVVGIRLEVDMGELVIEAEVVDDGSMEVLDEVEDGCTVVDGGGMVDVVELGVIVDEGVMVEVK